MAQKSLAIPVTRIEPEKAHLDVVFNPSQASPPPSPPLGWESHFETVHSKGGFYDEATGNFISFNEAQMETQNRNDAMSVGNAQVRINESHVEIKLGDDLPDIIIQQEEVNESKPS